MGKFTWQKSGKIIRHDVTVIFYECADVPYTIESRRKQIQHANGYPGTWEHTSYFVVKDGKDIKEFQTLKDASELVTNEHTRRSDLESLSKLFFERFDYREVSDILNCFYKLL